jgi:hypothetical protein
MVRPAVSDFDCAGFVGVTDDCQPFPDGGPIRRGWLSCLSLEQQKKNVTAWPYNLSVFGERPLARR